MSRRGRVRKRGGIEEGEVRGRYQHIGGPPFTLQNALELQIIPIVTLEYLMRQSDLFTIMALLTFSHSGN